MIKQFLKISENKIANKYLRVMLYKANKFFTRFDEDLLQIT